MHNNAKYDTRKPRLPPKVGLYRCLTWHGSLFVRSEGRTVSSSVPEALGCDVKCGQRRGLFGHAVQSTASKPSLNPHAGREAKDPFASPPLPRSLLLSWKARERNVFFPCFVASPKLPVAWKETVSCSYIKRGLSSSSILLLSDTSNYRDTLFVEKCPRLAEGCRQHLEGG